jgi:hypothetical protein
MTEDEMAGSIERDEVVRVEFKFRLLAKRHDMMNLDVS